MNFLSGHYIIIKSQGTLSSEAARKRKYCTTQDFCETSPTSTLPIDQQASSKAPSLLGDNSLISSQAEYPVSILLPSKAGNVSQVFGLQDTTLGYSSDADPK